MESKPERTIGGIRFDEVFGEDEALRIAEELGDVALDDFELMLERDIYKDLI